MYLQSWANITTEFQNLLITLHKSPPPLAATPVSPSHGPCTQGSASARCLHRLAY